MQESHLSSIGATTASGLKTNKGIHFDLLSDSTDSNFCSVSLLLCVLACPLLGDGLPKPAKQ
jgi:hypothetical protein